MRRLRRYSLLIAVVLIIFVAVQTIACGESEDSVWQEATTANTVEACEAYLEEYPDGRYVAEATSVMEDLRWQEAQQANTIDAFQAYLEDYPSGRHTEEAREAIASLAKIAFYSDRDGNHEIYVMNADGSGQINLTDNPADDLGPAWPPDGSRIAFHSERDGNPEIYVMNADGSDVIRLTTAGGEFPVWSPAP
jgi:hypothetical protein